MTLNESFTLQAIDPLVPAIIYNNNKRERERERERKRKKIKEKEK